MSMVLFQSKIWCKFKQNKQLFTNCNTEPNLIKLNNVNLLNFLDVSPNRKFG